MNLRRDLGASRHNLGNLLGDLGQPAEAIAEFRAAAAIREALVRDGGGPRCRAGISSVPSAGSATPSSGPGRPSEAADAYRLAIAHQRAALAEAGPEAIDERRARLSELLAALDREADG